MARFEDRLGAFDPEAERKKQADPSLLQAALEEDKELQDWASTQQAKIEQKFDAKEDAVRRNQLIEKLAHAVTQFGAAKQGAKTGVDMSNLQFAKTDFENELNRLEQRRGQEMGELSGTRRRLGELVEARRKAAGEKEERARAEETRKQERQEEMGLRQRQLSMQERAQAAEMAMKDPESEESKRAQERAKSLTGRDFSGASAATIQGMLPSLLSEKKSSLTKAQEAVDKEFGKEYVEFVAKGGKADAKKLMSQLDEVSKSLEKTDTATGPLIGLVPKIGRDVFTPEGAALEDTVGDVVQRSLKSILGGQFSEREADRLIERAYNPRLSEQENKKRVDRLLGQLKEAYNAKVAAANYYEENGTLVGFKGQLARSANEFLSEEDKEEKGVRMSFPDGTVRMVPQNKVERARELGAK